MGEGRTQLRLVIHKQDIVANQPRVLRPLPATEPVSGEQQSRADHVNCSNDDCGFGRIVTPLLIVLVLAAKGADAETTSDRDRIEDSL